LTDIVKEQSMMSEEIKERIAKIKKGIVPDGYKETQLGIIPMEWKVKQLGQLGSIYRGKGIPKSKLADEGVPCIIYGELYTKYNNVIEDVESRTDSETAENGMEIKFGDILFTGSGETAVEIGKAAMYINRKSAYIGGDLIVLRPKNKIKNKVYGYLLNTDFVNVQKYKKAQGHSVVHIYGDNIKRLYVPLIPSNEQQKIADILSAWDRAIELKESLIKEKEERKKGLKSKIFSETNLRDWKKYSLGEIGEFRTSSVNKKDNIDDEQVKLLNYMDVYNNKLITSNIDYMITTATQHQVVTNNVKIGDVFFTPSSETRDDIGHSAVAIKQIDDLVYSYHLIRYRINPNIEFDLGFRAYCFNNDYILKQMSRLCTGSTRYTLSISDLESIEFYLPPLDEQKKIANLLSTADKEIDLLKQELSLLKEQKKGLMQLLLTGIVRVGEVESRE